MDDDDGLTGTLGGSGDAAAGVTKSEPPAPPREEMVANAVAFLRHPQVATSPEHSKRAFLEKKGLTEPEIAEAFRRVPQDKKADAADGADAKTRANDAKDPKGASKEQGLRWTQVVARAGAAVAAVSWAYKTFRPKSDFDSRGAAAPRVPPPLRRPPRATLRPRRPPSAPPRLWRRLWPPRRRRSATPPRARARGGGGTRA